MSTLQPADRTRTAAQTRHGATTYFPLCRENQPFPSPPPRATQFRVIMRLPIGAGSLTAKSLDLLKKKLLPSVGMARCRPNVGDAAGFMVKIARFLGNPFEDCSGVPDLFSNRIGNSAPMQLVGTTAAIRNNVPMRVRFGRPMPRKTACDCVTGRFSTAHVREDSSMRTMETASHLWLR